MFGYLERLGSRWRIVRQSAADSLDQPAGKARPFLTHSLPCPNHEGPEYLKNGHRGQSRVSTLGIVVANSGLG